MCDAAEGHNSNAEESATESVPAASSASTSPMLPASEQSSADGSASSSMEEKSSLLQKIKNLQNTQKALKDEKKRCAIEIKNAMKRKKRLQGKASQLSDADLVEVLRMRKAKKENVQTPA